MPTTQHRKSSKPTSAAGGSGKITNTSSASGSVALRELLLSADGVERQLTFAVDGDLSQKHLQEALQNTQQLVGKLKTEVKRLLTKVADLELSQNASVKKSVENELHTEITKLGSSFQFLFSPFQNPKFDPFSRDHSKPDFGPYDMARYANTSNKELGLVAELYAHVDKRFYSFMIDGDEFGDIFLQAASNAQSSSVERLKSSASGIFDLGVKKNLFGKDSETTRERIENLRVRTLLGLDLLLEDQVVPPLLYLHEDTADIGKLFLNPLLMKMARIVLYGPSMAEKSNASIRVSSPFHRRAKVTPGAIAWCSIVAHYLLSSDTELLSSGIGFHSKYDYPGDFENYKMMMILGRNDNRTWYRKLMSTWDKTLFPGKNKGADNDSEEDPAVRSGVIGSNAVTDLMQRMKIAGSNMISKSDSDSESSESESSESDSEVVPQHKSRPSASTIEIEDSGSNDEHTILRAPMSELPQPQPQPQPQLRLTINTPMVFDNNAISYAAPLPPPPQPRLSTPKTSAAMVIDDDSHIISYATPLPPPPPPQPSTQNLRTDNNIPHISTPAHLEAPPPELDSESLQQAHVHNPPDSPLSELADMEPIIPLTQPTVLAQNSKVGKKSKTKKQSDQVPGPARRSGRSKSGLNAAQQEGNEGVDKKGKGRSRHSGN